MLSYPLPRRFYYATLLLFIGMLLTYNELSLLWVSIGVIKQIVAIILFWLTSGLLMKQRQPYWFCTLATILLSIVFVCCILTSTILGVGLPFGVSLVSASLIIVLMVFYMFSKFMPTKLVVDGER